MERRARKIPYSSFDESKRKESRLLSSGRSKDLPYDSRGNDKFADQFSYRPPEESFDEAMETVNQSKVILCGPKPSLDDRSSRLWYIDRPNEKAKLISSFSGKENTNFQDRDDVGGLNTSFQSLHAMSAPRRIPSIGLTASLDSRKLSSSLVPLPLRNNSLDNLLNQSSLPSHLISSSTNSMDRHAMLVSPKKFPHPSFLGKSMPSDLRSIRPPYELLTNSISPGSLPEEGVGNSFGSQGDARNLSNGIKPNVSCDSNASLGFKGSANLPSDLSFSGRKVPLGLEGSLSPLLRSSKTARVEESHSPLLTSNKIEPVVSESSPDLNSAVIMRPLNASEPLPAVTARGEPSSDSTQLWPSKLHNKPSKVRREKINAEAPSLGNIVNMVAAMAGTEVSMV